MAGTSKQQGLEAAALHHRHGQEAERVNARARFLVSVYTDRDPWERVSWARWSTPTIPAESHVVKICIEKGTKGGEEVGGSHA